MSYSNVLVPSLVNLAYKNDSAIFLQDKCQINRYDIPDICMEALDASVSVAVNLK
jgi:hypothetical protein